MQPTGRQQLLGQSGEAPHAHITTTPVRGLREAGHAKLRFHQCLPSVNRPLNDYDIGGAGCWSQDGALWLSLG
jgi:hypothetical protein